jgi:putative nucleotidyltransferase with HDIG domain
MLTQRAEAIARFTRKDAVRLAIAAGILIAVLTAILGSDILPQPTLTVAAGDLAPRDIVAPKTLEFQSDSRTAAARADAAKNVAPQYDFTTEKAIALADEQQVAFEQRVQRVDTAFSADITPDQRTSLLQVAISGLTDSAQATLLAMDPGRWSVIRTESARVLDALLRAPLKDTEVAETRTRLAGLMAGGLNEKERALAAELIGPLVVPNSSFSQELTDQEIAKATAAVQPVMVSVLQGEKIVPAGERVSTDALEKIVALGLKTSRPDVASFFGWFLLSVLIVGLLLGWLWRFRPTLWHRDNVLVLTGLLVVGATLALKITAGRSILQFFLPTAAIGMLLAILLDASLATVVIGLIAVIAGAVNGGSLELTSYVLLGGLTGIVMIRKGDRLQVFVQAAFAVFVVNAMVVTTFSLLGARDVQGVIQLWFASAASALGSGVAAVGTFAVLGSVFGILTVFQLLELANPSQPLLRRLLVETPGTYHHSLMVGNLAERAAESIGGDPLVTRVAAYYHDIGKLANPLGFIENQAGGDNVHDTLDPEVSAAIVKQHVADGIDLAYKSRLPKALIAYIPQHHGTAIMGYFYGRARERAAEPYGGLGTAEGRQAADAVDERPFRHSGPKPQSREAAIIMLADSVEASVRSLESRDEPAIRAMVTRIIEERIADGQFDECDLTLRDLERIREAFVAQLLGMYHTRIAYPQSKVVEIESRRNQVS